MFEVKVALTDDEIKALCLVLKFVHTDLGVGSPETESAYAKLALVAEGLDLMAIAMAKALNLMGTP